MFEAVMVSFSASTHRILQKIQLRDAIALKVKDGPQEIDILDWTTRAALEIIGQSVGELKYIFPFISLTLLRSGPRCRITEFCG